MALLLSFAALCSGLSGSAAAWGLMVLTLGCGALSAERLISGRSSGGLWLVLGALHALWLRPAELLFPLALAGLLLRLGHRGLLASDARKRQLVACCGLALLVGLMLWPAFEAASKRRGQAYARLVPSSQVASVSLPEPTGSSKSFERRWREVRALQLSGLIGPRFPYALAGGLGWLAFRGPLGLAGVAWWVPAGAALVLAWLARQSVSSSGAFDLILALGARLAAGGLLLWLVLRLVLCLESWADACWPRGLRWFDTLARRPALAYLLASLMVWLLGAG